MLFVKIWIHLVWGTKSRTPFLSSEKRKKIIEHIISNAKEKKIIIDTLNGHKDHLHCLISLSAIQSVSDVMRLIKGESSLWINKQKITDYNFEWAAEYYAASVSESDIFKVRNYIRNQEEHHRNKTWDEEQNDLFQEYGFGKFSD